MKLGNGTEWVSPTEIQFIMNQEIFAKRTWNNWELLFQQWLNDINTVVTLFAYSMNSYIRTLLMMIPVKYKR
jgi:hypothetical protein